MLNSQPTRSNPRPPARARRILAGRESWTRKMLLNERVGYFDFETAAGDVWLWVAVPMHFAGEYRVSFSIGAR